MDTVHIQEYPKAAIIEEEKNVRRHVARERTTKGEEREQHQRALAAKGQKHNYARWHQIEAVQQKRAQQARNLPSAGTGSPARKPPPSKQ